MTLDERKKYMDTLKNEKEQNNEDFTIYDLIPTQSERSYAKIKDKILNRFNRYFSFIRDTDIIVAAETISNIEKNIEDVDFLVSLMRIDFSKFSRNDKSALLLDIKKYTDTWLPSSDNNRKD